MKTAPTSTRSNNPDVKRVVIAFQQPQARQLRQGQYCMYKLCTTPADVTLPICRLSIPFFDNRTPKKWIKFWCRLQAVLKGQNVTQGPPSYTVAKTFLKGDTLTVFEQAEINHGTQSVPNFKLCLGDVAEHVFPEKVGQTQKCYMQRNLWLMGPMTVKEWVAQVSELNKYLNDFPAHNRNKTQPLNEDELMDILEYGVPAMWHREITVQGFDPVDQGLKKIVEFCTRLELCKPSADKPKDKKSPKSENAGKCKADTPTKPAGKQKFYCNIHGLNKNHDTKDFFELTQHAKHAKQGKARTEVDK
eukprot:6129557-Ditylum_brightwellii.AAC.1